MSLIDSTRLKALIKLMLESEDQERYGFELLLEEVDFSDYFDALREAELFERTRVQLEKKLDRTGTYYANKPWAAIEYLLRCAKSGKPDVVRKVLQVVESVGHGNPPLENYLVQGPLTEIIGAVPLVEIRGEHIALVTGWLSGQSYSWHTVDALATGLLPKLIESRERIHAEWACRLIDSLTLLHCAIDTERGNGRTGFVHDESLVSDFLEAHVPQLASHAGDLLLPVLLKQSRAYFEADGHGEGSFYQRPAIEDHEQNRDYDSVPKALVNSCRAAMLAWIDGDFDVASKQFLAWLSDESEIVRRLAIHLLTERFKQLRKQVKLDVLFHQTTMFAYGHLHESYRFLKTRFCDFTPAEKHAAIEAIRTLVLEKGAESPGFVASEKLRWLSAIDVGVSQDADKLRDELDASGGAAPAEYPDFYYYISSGSSGWKSPLIIPEVTKLCASEKLVHYANAFHPDDRDWDGPSVRGLCDAIATAIVESPDLFVEKLEGLQGFAAPYQYSVFRGFFNVLEKNRDALSLEIAWPKLLANMEALLNQEEFWIGARQNARKAEPDADWVPSVIAELLRKAASSDDVLAVDTYMARAVCLVELLLSKCERLEEPSGDVVTRVINTSLGKAFEALFSCALRIQRNKKNYSLDDYRELRGRIQRIFDFELARSGAKSIEFSTLSGNYVNHLRFIDEHWLDTNFGKLFPVADTTRLQCAVAGLAFAQASKVTYEHLVNCGAIDAALQLDLVGRNAREQLLRRVGLAYLWRIESLDGERMKRLREAQNVEDLLVVVQLIRSAPAVVGEDQVGTVTSFWDACVRGATEQPTPPDYKKRVLAATAGFAKHIPSGSLSENHKYLLRAVSPFAWYPHEEIFFTPELLRLLSGNEEFVGLCMFDFLQGMRRELGENRPFHDFEGRYLEFVKRLYESYPPLATAVANELRHLKEFKALPSVAN